ncbi:MAG: FAD-dependent oxidoreductase, partial [Pseudomonadota bacterium]
AHVEQEGVWLIEGGMHTLARALVTLGEALGVRYHFGAHVAGIETSGARATGIRMANGDLRQAQAVIFNGDVNALASGFMGSGSRSAVEPVPAKARSLSALVWSLIARTDGLPLSRHTVFFARTYRREFQEIFEEERLPSAPTVYVCAQDRDAADRSRPNRPERLHIHVNAPSTGDRKPLTQQEIDRCTEQSIALMSRAGLRLLHDPAMMRTTTPTDFDNLFPGTGGALYGRANHGPMASFQRPGSRTRLPGLYVAGGSAHPGPGVPMAAMSGRLAAAALIEDMINTGAGLGSTRRSHRAAISGGTLTG